MNHWKFTVYVMLLIFCLIVVSALQGLGLQNDNEHSDHLNNESILNGEDPFECFNCKGIDMETDTKGWTEIKINDMTVSINNISCQRKFYDLNVDSGTLH